VKHAEHIAAANSQATPTLAWVGDVGGVLRLIDQTLLPTELREIDCDTLESVWEAIRSLRVRGAPAIGVAAAYGVVLGVRGAAKSERREFDRRLAEAIEKLSTSRPTAVNLFWSLERMRRLAEAHPDQSPAAMTDRLLAEARSIEAEDRRMCAAIGQFGAPLLADCSGVLTHCNAGGLATAGDGTALSVIFAAVAAGKTLHVYADETRPLLQGARLTAWELMQRKIDVTIICDSAAGWLMKQRKVQAVVTGADRIAATSSAGVTSNAGL
jgi:methylthioribose-1-phosphate isomerase